MTFEEFLKECVDKQSDCRLVPSVEEDGTVKFYAHPHGVDGSTVDFSVTGDSLTNLQQGDTQS